MSATMADERTDALTLNLTATLLDRLSDAIPESYLCELCSRPDVVARAYSIALVQRAAEVLHVAAMGGADPDVEQRMTAAARRAMGDVLRGVRDRGERWSIEE